MLIDEHNHSLLFSYTLDQMICNNWKLYSETLNISHESFARDRVPYVRSLPNVDKEWIKNVGKLKRRDHSENLDRDGRIILIFSYVSDVCEQNNDTIIHPP